MIRSVFCPKCRLRFEVIESPHLDSARCPHCAGVLDLGQHSRMVEKLGEYQIIEMIGQGGMGQVFKARDPKGQLVAVKLMSIDLMSSAELTERFEREMDILASLQHENIVRLLDRGVTSAYKYFVMELVEGVTLRSLINTGSLTEQKIASIAVETLKALGYAHARGIIHRDIKPENILFDRHGKVKITDFGLARRLSTAGGDSQGLTATNAFMGTENYMSPEQKINPKAVTHKSDIYSFGIVLYEMLSGGHLPMGLFQPPSSFKPMEDFWDNLCFRMLDINPDLRPENGVSLAQEIEAFLAKQEPSPQAPVHVSVMPASKAPAAPAKSMEDTFAEENRRIQEQLKRLLDEGYRKTQAGGYKEALKIWENALLLTSDAEEQKFIREWMDHCRFQLQEQNAPTKVAFLCPACRKTFDKSASEPIPPEFTCPNCQAPLKYDAPRKQIALIKPKQPTPPTEPGPAAFGRPVEKPCEGNLLTQVVVVLAVVLIGDFVYPTAMNGFLAWMFEQGLGKLIQTTPNVAAIYLRYLLEAALVILGAILLGQSILGMRDPSRK